MLEPSKNTHKFDIIFQPFTENLYRLLQLDLHEEIGGALPKGSASFLIGGLEEGKKLLTDCIEGKLVINNQLSDSISYTIPVVITSRNFEGPRLDITFVCAPSEDFYAKQDSHTYKNIDDAMSILLSDYKKFAKSPTASGYPKILVNSNVNKNANISQPISTPYEALRVIACGYKYGSLVGFGLDGFFIKDIEQKTSRVPIFLGRDGFVKTSVNNLIYSPNLNNNSTLNLCDLSNNESSSASFSSSFTSIIQDINISNGKRSKRSRANVVKKGFEDIVRNYIHNTLYFESPKINSSKITNLEYIPGYKLGDTILINDLETKDTTLPKKRYVVWSNDLFIRFYGADFKSEQGGDFSWNTVVVGIDEGNWSKTKY